MTRKSSIGMLAVLAVAAMLATGLAAGEANAAKMVPLSDAELDAIYAEGLVLDLQFDIAISEGAEIVSNAGWEQVQQLIADGFQIRGTGGDGSTVVTGTLLDPSGASVTLNPANLVGPFDGGPGSGGWGHPGIDIDVVNGDVAIGINLAVFINSIVTDTSIYQFNFNFSDPGDFSFP
jgi:hypothetical protein